MQIKVTVSPYYEKDLETSYPKLGRYLRHQDSGLVRENPSFYELAGRIDTLLYRYDGTKLYELLFKYKGSLKKAYKRIETHIADWDLASADKLLYSIEDIFDEIESQLD